MTTHCPDGIGPSRRDGESCGHVLIRGLSAVLLCIGAAQTSLAQTGTFLDRQHPNDIRVVSFNVYQSSIYGGTQKEKFQRIIQALDPDVVCLQEASGGDGLANLLNEIAPLPDGASWYGAYAGETAASKYPSSSARGVPAALIDLPDDRYGRDMFVTNNHFTCCTASEPPDPLDSREESRQRSADYLVTVMQDARTSGGRFDLPQGTPMLVVGDLNIVMEPDVYNPLGTLLTGDIYFEDRYGADSPPDWDGTSLVDSHPLHNARGPEDYTWRDDGQHYDPGRLDYILYTDSVLREASKFVLNTVAMTPAERAATGLQEFDVTLDQSGSNYDHLPVVVDFRFVPEPATFAYVLLAAACLAAVRRRHP